MNWAHRDHTIIPQNCFLTTIEKLKKRENAINLEKLKIRKNSNRTELDKGRNKLNQEKTKNVLIHRPVIKKCSLQK